MGRASISDGDHDRDAMPTGIVRCSLHGVEDNSPAATISFEPERGGRLTVFSGLSGHRLDDIDAGPWFGNICCDEEHPDDAPAEVRSRHGRLTLVRAQLIRQSYGHPTSPQERPPVTRESFACDSAMVGAHVGDGEQDLVKGLGVRTALTQYWAPPPYPEHEGGFGRPHTVRLEPVEPISFNIPLGVLSLTSSDFLSTSVSGLSFGLQPSWHLLCHSPVSLARLSDEFVVPLVGLVSLLTGLPDGVDAVHAGGGTDAKHWSGRWHDALWPTVEPYEPDVLYRHHAMPFDQSQPELTPAVERWFQLASDHPQMKFIAEALATSGTVIENFMSTIGAIEQWFDISRTDRRMPKADFRRLKRSIRDHIGEGDWDVIADRISHADLHDLRSKLTRIAEEAGWPIGRLVLWMPEFIGSAVAYRNGMTHGWSSARPLGWASLRWTTWTLKLLLIHDILRFLGFEEAKVAHFIDRCELGQAITDPSRNILLKDAVDKRGSEQI